MSKFTLPNTPSSEITSEAVYFSRRELLAAAAAIGALSVAKPSHAQKPQSSAAGVNTSIPPKGAVNGFKTTEAQTSWRDATNYNNFYEFGTNKDDPARNIAPFRSKPWSVTISGECEVKGSFNFEDLVKGLTIEERIYRMRCVEGWSMVIPWNGFSLGNLLKRFKPTSKAKYVAFKTLYNPKLMPGQAYRSLDWPYREGLRMDEAMNPLTILSTGIYGKALPGQNGAPLRLVVPWKYGFKGIKSIVSIEFTQSQPPTSWNLSAANEYGFYSNVNPAVAHPRWSQKTERRIAGGFSIFSDRIPTLPFNGYAEQVASLYRGMDLRRNF